MNPNGVLDIFPELTLRPNNKIGLFGIVNNNFIRLENKMDSFISLMQKHTSLVHHGMFEQAYQQFKECKI